MKKLKICGALTAALLAGVAFTACSDDDKDGSAPTEITLTLGNTGLRVSKAGNARFEYENGRLVWFRDYDGEEYEVSGNFSKITDSYYDDEEYTNFSFNGSGYITGFKIKEEWDEDDYGRGSYSESYSLSYDGSGHLTKVSYSGSGTAVSRDGQRESESISGTTTLTWSNGRLQTVKDVWTGKEGSSGTYHCSETTDYEYSDAERNPLKQPTLSFALRCIDTEVIGALALVNYLGVGSSYFPTRMYVSEVEDDGYGSSSTYNLSVSLNGDDTVDSEWIDNSRYYYAYEEVDTSSRKTNTRAQVAPLAGDDVFPVAHRRHSRIRPSHRHCQ